MKHRILLLLSLLFVAGNLWAEAKYYTNDIYPVIPPDPVLSSCVLTKAIEPEHIGPDEFPLTNNLARNSGDSLSADGERIVIVGRVFNENCVPMSDVMVYLWQRNIDGDFQFNPEHSQKVDTRPLRKHAAEDEMRGDSDRRTGVYMSVHEDSSTESTKQFSSAVEFPKRSTQERFIGAGKTLTDNMGFFSFITIRPGSRDKLSPRLNIKLSHKSLPYFASQIFFADNVLLSDKTFAGKKIEDVETLIMPEMIATDEFGSYRVYYVDLTVTAKPVYKRY